MMLPKISCKTYKDTVSDITVEVIYFGGIWNVRILGCDISLKGDLHPINFEDARDKGVAFFKSTNFATNKFEIVPLLAKFKELEPNWELVEEYDL